MNFLHMKYAVEIADTRSLNKAAEKLFVGQSNLSRSVKELESSLGITIFERSARGMTLTPDGEEFIKYARNILRQVSDIENMFSRNNISRKRLSVSVPRASYIGNAFARFSNEIGKDEKIDIFYKETDLMSTIKNIIQEDYKIGIIRHAENSSRYLKEMLDEKNINYEIITSFTYSLVMNSSSPLASKEELSFDDLKDYIEITHADPNISSLHLADIKNEELPYLSSRRITVFERGSQLELLSENNETFMWVSPIPEDLLGKYGLTLRKCPQNNKIYRDAIIYRKDYSLTNIDNKFIEYVIDAKRKLIH